MYQSVVGFCCLLLAFSSASIALADRLQLSNGDEIEGKLIETSEKEIRFRHEILGEIVLPRDRVHAIELGLKRGGKRIMADGSPAGAETPEQIVDRLVNPDVTPNSVKKLGKNQHQHRSADAAIAELRIKGVDDQTMNQLHGMLPGFGSPEVQKYFHEQVNGLMSGSLSIGDIRKDAIDARDELKELMDDLGPSGAALNGYFGILDSFIEQTDPNAPLTPPGIAPLPRGTSPAEPSAL